jgi:hypothetical protein
MYLKSHPRVKDGKEHRYWSIAEKYRCADGRVVDRHLLYLGEINDAYAARGIAVGMPRAEHCRVTVANPPRLGGALLPGVPGRGIIRGSPGRRLRDRAAGTGPAHGQRAWRGRAPAL